MNKAGRACRAILIEAIGGVAAVNINRPGPRITTDAPPSTDFDDVLRELNNEKITVKLGGKVQKIPAFKAVALRQRADAIGGSVRIGKFCVLPLNEAQFKRT